VNERFLAAWRRPNWGDHEDQPTLRSFINPETFRPVIFSCGDQALTRGDELWVAGCGLDINQDIWLQRRSLTALAEASSDSVWESATSVTESVLPVAEPAYVADEEGRHHAFWVELLSEDDAPFGARTTSIHYSQFVDGRWARPVMILSSPEGKTDRPAVAVDGKGRILATWSGGNRGEIYFSHASTTGASLPSDWAKPLLVTEEEAAAASPAIGVGPDGAIYIVYAVPIGDRRGVYLVKSTDGGATWSEPLIVFDGVAAQWEVAAEPRLTIGASGDLHVLWLHGPLPTSVRGNQLYYTHSTDSGESWSAAQRVISTEQEDSPVVWHGMVGVGEKILYRSWQEWTFNRLNIWSQESFDSGVTWSEPVQVSVIEELNVPTALIADGAGQAHLFYSTKTGIEGVNSRYVINHRIWRDGNWQEAEALIPDRRNVAAVHALAALAQNDRISVLFSATIRINEAIEEDEKNEGPEAVVVIATERLYYSARLMELPGVLPTPPPQMTATPTPTASPDVTATPEPTPTLVFPTDAGRQSRGLLSGQLNETAGIIFGLGAAALLVIGLFAIIGVNRFRSGKVRR
jgi:hypothetical protein